MLVRSLMLWIGVLAAPVEDHNAFTLSPDRHLVLLKAVKVSAPDMKDAGRQECTFEVVEVFVGPWQLRRHLVDLTNYVESPYVGSGSFPPRELNDGYIGEIHQGEEGFWWITKCNHELKIVTDFRVFQRDRLTWFPFRKVRPLTKKGDRRNTKERYEIGVAWAKALQQVAEAKDDQKRFQLLTQDALRKDSPASGIAIFMLGTKGREASVREFLKALVARKELSVIGQVALDQVLSSIPRADWQDSRQRRQLLERWITQPIPHASDYPFVVERLKDALRPTVFHESQLDLPLLLPILEPALLGKRRLPAGRARELAGLIGDLSSTTAEGWAALPPFLIRLIESSPYPEVRFEAASFLYVSRSLTKEQIRILENVLRTTRDRKLAEAIRKALEEAKIPWSERFGKQKK